MLRCRWETGVHRLQMISAADLGQQRSPSFLPATADFRSFLSGSHHDLGRGRLRHPNRSASSRRGRRGGPRYERRSDGPHEIEWSRWTGLSSSTPHLSANLTPTPLLQHANKTESAVRLVHGPSGIVVAIQESRSQGEVRPTSLVFSQWSLTRAPSTTEQEDCDVHPSLPPPRSPT